MDLFELAVAQKYENLTNKKVIYENDKTYYMASDICTITGIKCIYTSTTNYSYNEKQLRKVKTNGGPQNKTFLTFDGLKRLIKSSRTAKVISLARDLGFDITTLFQSPIESDTLNSIKTSFKQEEMIHQYSVKNYRIDLYFPKYKLAIECDEIQHKRAKNLEKDIIRQNTIEEILECKFIRFSPYDKDFNIFEVINKIYSHIREYPII